MVQEGQYERCIEIGKGNGSRCLTDALLGKQQQQPERVPVSSNGLRADRPMLGEVLREEPLEQRNERRRPRGVSHAGPPSRPLPRTARSAFPPRPSGWAQRSDTSTYRRLWH